MNPSDGRFNVSGRRKCRNSQRKELAGIQSGIIVGFDQVEQGVFASGSGQEAIERAFNRAVQGRGT